jgi:hypothetical protein
MSRDEVIAGLRANIDKVVRVTFEGDDVRDMTIVNLDDEGFVNKIDGELFWSTFDDVENVEPLSTPTDRVPGP